MEASLVGMYVIQDLLFRYVNATMAGLFGYTPAEIIDTLGPADLLVVEQRQAVRENLTRRAAGEPGTPYEVKCLHKNGTTFDAMVWGQGTTFRGRPASVGSLLDLSAIKQKEQTLQQARDYLQALYDASPDMVFVHTADGRLLDVNANVLTTYGVTREEILTADPQRFMGAAHTVGEAVARLRQAMIDGHAQFDWVAKKGDGSEFPVEVRLRRLAKTQEATSEDQPALLAMVRDLSAQKRAEEAKRRSEGKLREILAVVPVGIARLDKLEIKWANAELLRMLGYSGCQLLSRSISMLFETEEEFTRVGKELVNHHARHETGDVETRWRRMDGALLDVHIRYTWRTEQGEDDQGRMVIAVYDITHRRQAEMALRESEKRYRNFVEMLPQIVYETDLKGNLVSVNKSAMGATGYNEEDLARGINALEFIVPKERQRALASIMQVLKGAISSGNEYTIIRRDGTTFPAMTYSSAQEKDGRIVGLMGMMVDISERKRLEEERQRAQKMESVGLLAGGIAHDFNNLLTAIWGGISLARMRRCEPELLAEILGEADSACRRAKSLTQQLLTFSRGGKPVKKVVALDSLLREVTSFSLRGTSVTCHVSLPQDLPFVEADEGQLGQVFQNLLINAVQAMPDGGVITVTGQVFDLAEENCQGLSAGSYVEIVVEDQGAGIPAEHIARIFEPYFTTKKAGSGLGLAVAYSILKNHGGAIAVDSNPGEGTVFRLRLPVAGPAGQVVLARSSGAVKGAGRVLVMDDEQLVRTITGEMLKVLGYTAVAVEEGGRAVQMYAEALRQGHPFRAVILDLTVPGGMGGKEAAQKILAVDPSARIIVASGYAHDAVMADYRRYGFVAVAPKPFSITDLAEALTQALVSKE